MIVQLKPTTNNNGPITSYLVGLINADSIEELEADNFKSYREANNDGLSYYITAEIPPQVSI